MFPTRRILTSGGDVYRDQYSLEFDGTNDHINTGTGIDLGSTTDFTITLWAKSDDWAEEMFMGKFANSSNRWYFRADENGYLNFFSIKDPGSGAANGIIYTGTTALTNGEWTHIALVADRSADTKGYINGVLDDTDTGTTPDLDIDIAADFHIGRVDTNYFTGNISEVTIWNTALSANQIKTLYNGREPFDARNIAKSNLKGYWRMGDGVLDHRQTDGLVADQVDATLGSELVTDGDFPDGDNWTGDGSNNWSISSNTAVHTAGAGGDLEQASIGIIAGKIYRLSFTVTVDAGNITPYVGSGASVGTVNSSGAKVFYQLASGSDEISFSAHSTFAGTLTDVSCIEVKGSPGVLVNFDGTDFKTDVPR